MGFSAKNVSYFKDVTEKHRIQYQKIIRQLLDDYIAEKKSTD